MEEQPRARIAFCGFRKCVACSIVLLEADSKIIGLTYVDAALGIAKDVNPKHRREC